MGAKKRLQREGRVVALVVENRFRRIYWVAYCVRRCKVDC